MDFRSINKFNDFINTLSGNSFPMTGEKSSVGFVRAIYIIFTAIVATIFLLTTSIGMLSFVPPLVAIREGGVAFIVTMEAFIIIPYLYSQHDNLRNLIGKMNSILDSSNDLEQFIRETVEPHTKHSKMYTMATTLAAVIWAGLPLFKLLETDRNSFTYTDFALPTYYPGAPFSGSVFFFAVVIQMTGTAYCSGKKTSVDVYIIYFISLVSAEYRYVKKQITDILNQVNSAKKDESVVASLQKCIQHHCSVMEVGQTLTKLLSVNIGITYLMCIIRFCFMGISVITLTDNAQRICYIIYMMGGMVQIFMLCLCSQELLDASTTVTDDGFHENWYERGNTVKSIFRTMGLGDRIKCRLSAFQIAELTVPTFCLILNQSYSICLLLLKVY